MTFIKYYQSDILIEKKINKNEDSKDFTVTESHLDLNNRTGEHNSPTFLDLKINKADSFQHAIDIYKQKFDEYDKKSFDWKGHSAGALKFYWSNGKTDVLTYLKLNYKGEEVMEFDFEEMEV